MKTINYCLVNINAMTLTPMTHMMTV